MSAMFKPRHGALEAHHGKTRSATLIAEYLEPRRLFAAGALDSSFGVNGAATIRVPDSGESIQDMQVRGGKTVVAFDANQLIRLNKDGGRDATFHPSLSTSNMAY